MRVLKITALLVLLFASVFASALAWLTRSEQGSRWLLQQGLGVAPVTIEASGVSGTFADGLDIETLYIALPTAEVRAAEILISWSPTGLLKGSVDIDGARIAELSVDTLPTESTGDPPADRLFWLQFPIHLYIESGQLDRLRIDTVEFENLRLAGTIGHGRLEIESLTGRTAGIDLQVSGTLAGPAPGQLEAAARWEMPVANLNGAGSFSGDIEKLGFSHVINAPEVVNLKGTIYDLFAAPTLAGAADWQSIRLAGETPLYSNAGSVAVHSDFRSARLAGNSTVLLEGWPEATLQLAALIDLDGIAIDTYSMDALGGQVTGSGHVDYRDRLRGQLEIHGTQIDTSLISADLPGRLGFDSTLLIESADAFALDVATASALIAGTELTGLGRAQWRDRKLATAAAQISADTNRLSADVKFGTRLTGEINAHAPDLASLWPGLQGSLNASIALGGSPENPQFRLIAEAASLSSQSQSFGSQSLNTLTLSGELQDSRLTGRLAATDLVAGNRQLGNLDFSLTGTLADHQSNLKLAGGLVNVELRATGGWDGAQLTQRFESGQVQPDGFASWRLVQNPQLRVSSGGGQISAHCWKQDAAGICIEASSWDTESLQTAVDIDGFALATLQPLLAEGYHIDGTVDADLTIARDTAGLHGELHWRQSPTVLSYADDIDEFRTVLDDVRIDLVSGDAETTLAVNVSGEQGLTMSATANVSGPLAPDSPFQAAFNGRLPSIGLLRPLVRRVVNPGELQGELTIDLAAGGTLGDPAFDGGVYLADATLGLLDAGILLSDINLAAESNAADRLHVTGRLRSGEGTAEIRGDIHATDNQDLVANLNIRGENLASVRVPDLSVDASPDLTLRIGKGLFDISGKLDIPHARAQLRDLPQSAIPRSADVIVHAPERATDQQAETIVTGDVEVLLGDDVRYSGFGLDSRLEGVLRLTQSRGGFLRSGGTVRIRDGFLNGYGKELRVDRGELTFTGALDDPLIDIQVSRESIYEGRQYTIGLRLTGSAQNVKTEPFSRPAMSERDVLAFLLLDRPAGSGNDASAAALALGLKQLVPGETGILGLDEVSFETNELNQAAMVAGKRINDDLYVRYVFGAQGQPGAFRIRYRLGRGFSLEASSGARQALDLIYLLER
jgi:translocation and assembly module TamB